MPILSKFRQPHWIWCLLVERDCKGFIALMFGHLHGPLGSVASSISMTFFFFCWNNFSVVCEIAKFIIYFCSLRGLRSTPRIVFSCARPPSHLSFLLNSKNRFAEVLLYLRFLQPKWNFVPIDRDFRQLHSILPRLLSLPRVSEIFTTQILRSLFVELRTSKDLLLLCWASGSMLFWASVSVLLICWASNFKKSRTPSLSLKFPCSFKLQFPCSLFIELLTAKTLLLPH